MTKENISKKKYVEFMSKLTGHTKSFIEKNMVVNQYSLSKSYTFKCGSMTYDTWVLAGRIYTQYFLDSTCQGSWYHDIDTLEYDWKYTEQQEDKDFKDRLAEHIDFLKETDRY